VETIAFYIFEILSLVLFILVAIALLIFFLRKDSFLITEITLSLVLIFTDCCIIGIRAGIQNEDHVFMVICMRFARALRVVVIYFRVEQY